MIAIRPMTPDDWDEVAAIFRQGIATGHATFEAKPPSWEMFDATRVPKLRLVADDISHGVVGWVAASQISTRQAYEGVVEHSIYVATEVSGRGVGRQLLHELVDLTERLGIWTIQASIFAENEASLRLHLSQGFRVVGYRDRIARMTFGPLAGTWRDTVLLERRSNRDPQ